VHIFPYSPREGTKAANLKGLLDAGIMKERLLRLKGVSWQCSLDFKKQLLGKILPVLIESRSKEYGPYWKGYADNYIKVSVKSALDLKNQLIPLRLKEIIRDFVLAESY
jgi:threonylcarbamoyladenosine tRNA methylthiotransferase MtaB